MTSSELSKGLYVISDLSMTNFYGASNDGDRAGFKLQFDHCKKSLNPGCATELQIRDYLSGTTFMLFAPTNYIDMEEVQPADDTLKHVWRNLLMEKIEFGKTRSKLLLLDEYRAEL